MATPGNFIAYLPWVVGLVIVIVCLVGWLIMNRDIGKK